MYFLNQQTSLSIITSKLKLKTSYPSKRSITPKRTHKNPLKLTSHPKGKSRRYKLIFKKHLKVKKQTHIITTYPKTLSIIIKTKYCIFITSQS